MTKYAPVEISKSEYRPIFPDSPFIHVADLVNPETNKTYREENTEKTHGISIGSLVEDIDTGIRLFVVYHTRDCDMTPLYALAVDPENTVKERVNFLNSMWHDGYPECVLRVIKLPQ